MPLISPRRRGYVLLSITPLGVFWPDRSGGRIYLGGRQLLDYENVDAWVMDPDTFEITHPRFSDEEATGLRDEGA